MSGDAFVDFFKSVLAWLVEYKEPLSIIFGAVTALATFKRMIWPRLRRHWLARRGRAMPDGAINIAVVDLIDGDERQTDKLLAELRTSLASGSASSGLNVERHTLNLRASTLNEDPAAAQRVLERANAHLLVWADETLS